jgi:hypothetical protein
MIEMELAYRAKCFPAARIRHDFLHKNSAEIRQFASQNPLRRAGMLVKLVVLGKAIPQSAVVGRA